MAPVTDQELKRVRTAARRNAVGIRESVLGRATSLADSAAMFDDPDRINTNTEKMMAVTAADILKVAKAYLRNDNRIVMYTTPAAAASPTAPPQPKLP